MYNQPIISQVYSYNSGGLTTYIFCNFLLSRSGFYEHDPSHGFESDMTAEEIFNMFFGGGFPSQTVYMRRGTGDPTGRFRTSAHSHRTYHSHQSAESREV